VAHLFFNVSDFRRFMGLPADQLRPLLSPHLPSPLAANATFQDCLTAAAAAHLSDEVLLPAVAESVGVEYHPTISARPTSSDFVSAIPIAFARKHKMLGLASPEHDTSRITVAMSDPAALPQLQVVARFLGRPVTPIFAPAAVVTSAINDAYQQRTGQAQELIDTLNPDQLLDELRRLAGTDDLLDNAARAPVIKLVNLILFEAVKGNASDIHVQPYEDRLMVRMRIDGVLYDSHELPRIFQDEVISRVKVMGRMNIAEKRLSQDGRATVQVGDRTIDLRIATLPTSFGERVVIRLLDKSARLYDLAELGMDSRTLQSFERLIAVEHGLILVTGPTGSGKSTTLYSALMRINSRERNILTLEDPIEYQLQGISQTQVNDKKGMTFAKGLRSVLRQDPDVIMVGEIRDLETATMAIQSSLTGHLVFSTLHTNDAASAVTRLLDLGIEPYLVASCLVGVLAQRLVRRICSRCGKLCEPNEPELRWLGVDRATASKMRNAPGCAECRNTGFRGRLGTFELLALDDDLRRLVQGRAAASEIRQTAIRAGTRTLRDDGIEKILAGVTTIAEVERVTLRLDDNSAKPDQSATPVSEGISSP
jgi:general secretion pathway protein E